MSTTDNPFDADPAKPAAAASGDDAKKTDEKAPAAAAKPADDKPAAKKPQAKKKADFAKAVGEKGVLSATSGQVTGTVDANSYAAPVLRISLIGWVGAAPLELSAEGIADIRKVLSELENQAR